MKILFTLLLSLLSLQMMATDYVDAINNATTKNEAGHRVIYEMNVGSFTEEGTFTAAQTRLADLKTLGVDIVWLMPVYPRGGGINSPYAATDFQKVNPAYGTINDLKDFVSRAHELNMEVWLDWVPNHTATDADWVTTHPEYYTKNGGSFVHPNNYSDVYQLNYNNNDLVNAMNDCLKFWIDQADIDGYRCDYVSSNGIPTSYWQNAIPLIKEYKSGKNITFLGEADIVNDATRLKNVGFDYDYAWGYQSSLANYGSNGVYASSLKTNAEKLLNTSSSVSFGRMMYVTNHDQNWNEDKKTLTQKYGNNRYALTVLAYTLYGMPLIYNGQEVGGNQALNYFEDTKINWSTKDNKMYNTIRTLTALKHVVPALSDKADVNWISLSPANSNVLAYTRNSGDSEVLVILNMATTATDATLTGLSAGEWSLWLDSENISKGTSRKQQTFTASQTFDLDAKGYRVYVKGTYPEESLPEPEVYTPTLENSDEISIFFETPTERDYAIWAWKGDNGGEYYCNNTSWPGDGMTLMGQTSTGSCIYKYIFTKVNDIPANFIISYNGGNNKVYDGITFTNHGYYVEGLSTPTQVITATDIKVVSATTRHDSAVYDLSGRRVASSPDSNLKAGIYIIGGKKVMIKANR